MKLKLLWNLFLFLMLNKAGIGQTAHPTINKAWVSLSEAYVSRNKSIMAIMDTLLTHKSIDKETYNELFQQITEYNNTLTISGSFNRKYMTAVARGDEKITRAFGKVILVSGAKGPDHYYLDQLEALENRISVCKQIFNEACAGNGRRDLVLPIEISSKSAF